MQRSILKKQRMNSIKFSERYEMQTNRLIARLDVKNNALVKGIHLEGLRVLGSPMRFGEAYYREGIDELVYMDVVASLYNRNNLSELIQQTARKVFIPLAVGGGVRSALDVKQLLRSGADKVIINTAAVKDPELIKHLVKKFGSSTIVVAIEAIKNSSGVHEVYIDNGREYTGKNVYEWAGQVQDYGAGEIILTSVDQEGTGKGLDFELVSNVVAAASIPVIVHGGIGSVEHLVDAYREKDVTAVCLSSMFHYELIARPDFVNDDVMGNTSFLTSGQRPKGKVNHLSVSCCKNDLRLRGVALR